MPDKPDEEIVVRSKDVNRPGLLFAGYEKFFDSERVEFIGLAETSYLQEQDEATQRERLELFFSAKPPVAILTRNIDAPPAMLELAQKYEVPLLRTAEPTSGIMATIISYLTTELAERITRHGVMVEVYGEGILIVGDSGVGKSETAVELIKRGHRLIADDAVEIRKVSSKTLIGSSPDNIRHFIELRGIGIVNARNIFGIGSVKVTEKIDLVIKLEHWDSEKSYDRLGLDDEYITILGNKVPATTVPVKPGRNLAIIIEIAAMNNRQKRMGYNAPQELMSQLGMDIGTELNSTEIDSW
jgi:HPr kinase/phosphorylase